MGVFLGLRAVSCPASVCDPQISVLMGFWGFFEQCVDTIRSLLDRESRDLKFLTFQSGQATAVVASELENFHALCAYFSGERLVPNIRNYSATFARAITKSGRTVTLENTRNFRLQTRWSRIIDEGW